MKVARYKFGLLALAYMALTLQFLVPHHHHQQATFLFLDTCPTIAHTSHEDHAHDDHDDDECHHPHSKSNECSALDHVMAAQKKQDTFAGSIDLDTPPLLPLLYVVDCFVPTTENACTTAVFGPPLYECISPAAHSLRGPPISA